MTMAKWRVVRNDEGEIVRRVLTDRIYIERKYCLSLAYDSAYNVLYVNGEIMGTTIPGSGETLKSLQETGELMADYYGGNATWKIR